MSAATQGPRTPKPGWLDPVVETIGVEQELSTLATRLRSAIQAVRAPTVGALFVTCSDEAQRESRDTFTRSFVEYLLPLLNYADRAALQTANLGGRYEWGSAPVAEGHYADTGNEWKVLVVRTDAHVAVTDAIGGATYGAMRRYAGEAVFCEALHRVFDEPLSPRPAIQELHAGLVADGIDRVAQLREAADDTRYLLAAICHARLAARRAMLDIQDHQPVSPTLYVVVPTVTINRKGHDTGLIVGAYVADHLGPERVETYVGLGDRPDRYVVHRTSHGALVEDDQLSPRPARDHREMIIDEWQSSHRPPEADPRLEEAIAAVTESGGPGPYSIPALATAVGLLAETNPVTGALFMFGNGLIGIHRIADAQRLLREAADDEVARDMLAELMPRLDQLEPDQAAHVARLLGEQFGRR